MDILNIFGEVIFTAAATTLKDAVVEAVRKNINLSRANLYGAVLSGANLSGANLYGANLTRAILSRANLYGANLTRANLTRANLDGAVLSGANLTRADLTRADLTRADLTRANLTGANLYGADLTRANLTRADLTRANLYGANLTGANLYGADLTGAILSRANLDGADLTGANLDGANLDGAILTGAKNAELVIARIQHIPEEGSFIGWKKCRNEVIVKLLIPETAKRSHGTERKCRASEAVVLEIFGAEEGVSSYNREIVYRKGETLKVDNFDDNRWNTCAPGIHFFITRKEAEACIL